ncbi:MAG: calcium/sodium antiporter [Bacteroidales bacterium]|nr:calcium/sodium antiporter [Bacteroidales bacterium]
MASLLPLFLLIVGFVALILGANWLVNGATSIGVKAKLSPLIIGLTIVAFGTSLPEMIVNIFACIKGSPELAIGNIIGSNTMNILLILGVSAMIFPIDVNKISIKRDIPAGFVATLAVTLMANDYFQDTSGTINWIEGLVLLMMGFGYLILTFKKESLGTTESVGSLESLEPDEKQEMPWGKTITYLVLGIIGLYIGGELVSNNAQVLALNWGMSESTVGLTVVATATSLPELITSIVAALKKNSAIAIGNVLGSNILNIFMVLGISSLITPLPFDAKMNQQLLILFAANAIMLTVVFTGKGRKISRFEGFILTLGYVGFMLFSLNPSL